MSANVHAANKRGQDIPIGALQISKVLSRYGFTAESLKAYEVGGLDPVAAAVRYMGGAAEIEDLAVLADTVAIGTVTFQKVEDLGDERRTSVVLRVDRSFKGVGQHGMLVIRQVSGPNPDGTETSISGETLFQTGQQYLVFASRSQWTVGRRPREGKYHVVLVARPGLVRDGYLTWLPASESVPVKAVEARIATVARSMPPGGG